MINYDRDALLTDFGKTTLKDRYLLPTEDSPQDGFLRAAKACLLYTSPSPRDV